MTKWRMQKCPGWLVLASIGLPATGLALAACGGDGGSGGTTPAPTTPAAAPAPVPTPPATPEGLVVSAVGEDFLEWTWNAVEGADGYGVQFSPDEIFGADGEVVQTDGTTHRVSELKSASSGYLRVRSRAGSLASTWSEPVRGETAPPNVAGDWLVDRGSWTYDIQPQTGCVPEALLRVFGRTQEFPPEFSTDFYLRIEQEERALTLLYWFETPDGMPDLDSAPPYLRFLGSIENGEFTMTVDAIWLGDRFVPWTEHLRGAGSYFVQGSVDEARAVTGSAIRWAARACPEYEGKTYTLRPSEYEGTTYTFQVHNDGTLTGTREMWTAMTLGSETWTLSNGPDPVTGTRIDP